MRGFPRPSTPVPADNVEGDPLTRARAKRARYFEESPFLVRWFEGERLRVIRAMVAEDPGHRILEIGAGAGHVARMFRRSHLVLIEPNAALLERARRNLAGYDAELLAGDIETLGLPDGSFDRVICTQVLELIEHPAQVLDHIARVLKPGGRAILTAANGPLSRGVKRVLSMPLMAWTVGEHVVGDRDDRLHQWTPDDFRRLVNGRFHVEEQHALPFALLPLRVCYMCRVRQPGAAASGRVES